MTKTRQALIKAITQLLYLQSSNGYPYFRYYFGAEAYGNYLCILRDVENNTVEVFKSNISDVRDIKQKQLKVLELRVFELANMSQAIPHFIDLLEALEDNY